MHGLKIGEVTDVRLMYDEAKKAIVAPVYFEVQPERIVGVGNRVYDTDEQPGMGALAFCAVVILTMFAAETFDPRLMWDAADEAGARMESSSPAAGLDNRDPIGHDRTSTCCRGSCALDRDRRVLLACVFQYARAIECTPSWIVRTLFGTPL